MKMRHVPAVVLLLGCLWVFLCPLVVVYAQSTSATINGQVTDAQGRIVPGVEVQAVNIDTAVVYPRKTNLSGIYAIPSIQPGRNPLLILKTTSHTINKPHLRLTTHSPPHTT